MPILEVSYRFLSFRRCYCRYMRQCVSEFPSPQGPRISGKLENFNVGLWSGHYGLVNGEVHQVEVEDSSLLDSEFLSNRNSAGNAPLSRRFLSPFQGLLGESMRLSPQAHPHLIKPCALTTQATGPNLVSSIQSYVSSLFGQLLPVVPPVQVPLFRVHQQSQDIPLL